MSGTPFELNLRQIDLDGGPCPARLPGGSRRSFLPGRPGQAAADYCAALRLRQNDYWFGVMASVANQTLIITTNNVAHQWRDELITKTSVVPDDIGEFYRLVKTIKPITVTTYQMLTIADPRMSRSTI
jgi:DNA excision repair protein ERCC-3